MFEDLESKHFPVLPFVVVGSRRHLCDWHVATCETDKRLLTGSSAAAVNQPATMCLLLHAKHATRILAGHLSTPACASFQNKFWNWKNFSAPPHRFRATSYVTKRCLSQRLFFFFFFFLPWQRTAASWSLVNWVQLVSSLPLSRTSIRLCVKKVYPWSSRCIEFLIMFHGATAQTEHGWPLWLLISSGIAFD